MTGPGPSALYESRRNEAYALVRHLENALAAHAQPVRATYADCGDLNHVIAKLRELVAFTLSVPK